MSNHSNHTRRFPAARAAIFTTALLAAACSAPHGQSLQDAVPALDARAQVPEDTVRTAFDARWDVMSAAWDGRSPITADAAVQCALANNRTLRRTLLELERRRAATQDAQLPPNPTVEFAIGAPLGMGVTPILGMLAQQVDWIWRRDAIVTEADAQLRTMLLETAAVIVATAAEARADYVDGAASFEQVALARQDEELAVRMLAAQQAARDEGESTIQALNQASVAASDAGNRLMNARAQLVVAQTRLLETIGRGDAGLDWRTADATARDARHACRAELPEGLGDDERLRRLVRERRLDLRAAEARIEGARARVSMAEGGRVPTLFLGAGYERDMEGDSAVMVQAQSQLPVWNDQRYRIAVARYELEIAQIDADRLWQRAVADARRALAALEAAEHHAAALRERTLPSLASSRRSLQASVEAGQRRPLDLWRLEQQETRVRSQVARAERDRARAALGFEIVLAGGRLPAGAAMPQPSGGMGGASVGAMGAMGVGADAGPDAEFTALESMQ